MNDAIEFASPDERQWREFDALATRSYGHRVEDITALREHAVTRVALRHGAVVAGGLGILVPQYFGGRPVPSACLAAGHVAPEDRGERLAELVIADRVRVLQDQGAVISSVWTKASAYGRHLGWEAVAPVFAWSVATDELKGSFSPGDFDIAHGLTGAARALHESLASQWHGPLQRPAWWWDWKQAKSDLTSYTFSEPGGAPVGLLSLATVRHPRHGMVLQVHDFWAAHPDAVRTMFAFLGRYSTRAETIDFRRGVMPPYPALLHNLHRSRVTAQSWHPWMIRILDIPRALNLRGWPADLDGAVTIALTPAKKASGPEQFTVVFAHGEAHVEPATGPADVTMTHRQLAAWYAGSYRSAASALLTGVCADSQQALATLLTAAGDAEPWLPDHF